MMKKVIALLLVFYTSYTGYAQPLVQSDWKELFAGPSSPENREDWLKQIRQWRNEERTRLHYDDSRYSKPEFKWMHSSFAFAQMMAHDRYFYDPVKRAYTVGKYLDDLKKRYGGIDAVLIWPTYPNIGVDSRNQYDLVHDMPGGVTAIRQMIKDFKNRGVHVFFPIMIWDHGTRKISLKMADALVGEMKELGADGMNGDTMDGVTADFQHASDSTGHPLIFQPELRLRDLKMVEWNLSSWGYFWNYTFTPGVSIYKWLEPRHKVFVTNRWMTDRTDDIQYAFFNGIGYNTWENIWGIWNRISERDAMNIRRIHEIYHAFPGWFSSPDWTPFVPVLQNGVFGAAFPIGNSVMYAFINRKDSSLTGDQIKLVYKKGYKYYDLWNGEELHPRIKDDTACLSFPIEKRGYGAVLLKADENGTDTVERLVRLMKILPGAATLSSLWHPLQQKIVAIEKTAPARQAPAGMVQVKGSSNYAFSTRGIMIEGDPLPNGVGVQYPWLSNPSRSQSHTIDMPDFYIDKFPVTNLQFKKFLDATHYHPDDDHNFLKDWTDGVFPQGWDNKPVTWVSIEDARAYAKWAGKRLPHEWEWQYAAQGNDGRAYPWGNQYDAAKVPPQDSSRSMRAPTDVDAFPEGASPFGVMDMMGNVWQWTDEYTDEHTRAAVVKGGGYYRSVTSGWYFPRVQNLQDYGKYLLMAPALDRSGGIGFRCVKDRGM